MKWTTTIGFQAAITTMLVLPLAVFACGKDPECDDITAWRVFTRVVLSQSYAGAPGPVDWAASFDLKGPDASIDITRHDAKETIAGTVGLVGGRVMVTKGLTLPRGYEIDALDAPVLTIHLLMGMLHRIFPQGPEQIVGDVVVDHPDAIGMKFATASASGRIPARWRVAGKVGRLSDGGVSFDLTLSWSDQQASKQGGSAAIHLKGRLAVLDGPVFRDSDSLEGWTTYVLGAQQMEQAGSTILDYGAAPGIAGRHRTIGDIRAFILAQDDPGVRDTSKDFTGFWKLKCDDPFGLQISHVGNEGKYAIVFCGPGGCGDVADSRLTFITGDRRYEVVGEDEFVQFGRSDERSTYHRCAGEAKRAAH